MERYSFLNFDVIGCGDICFLTLVLDHHVMSPDDIVRTDLDLHCTRSGAQMLDQAAGCSDSP